MDKEILENLGLSPSEASAYVTALELGSAVASDIAKRANLNRSNCYDALKRLINKGLVASINKNKKTYFEAVEPKQLFNLLKDKEQKLAGLIPELERKKGLVKEKEQKASIFEGYNGVKAIFEDILKTLKKNDEYLVFGAVDVPAVFERYILHWTKKRAEAGIKLKIIYHAEAKSFTKQTKKLPLTEMKVLPKSYITPAAINIYGDKTTTIVWTEKPIAFLVKNKEYSESFRSYFDILWNIAKPV